MAPRATWDAPLEAPECPEDWRTGPPDFVGIGAQRCGTSWWYAAAIRSHPQVQGSALGKEVHFFDRFWRGEAPPDLAARYARLFPRPPDKLTGEWTPGYMADFWTPALLRAAAPDARLLVMLRDPVERYRSALAFVGRRAAEGEGLRPASLREATWRGFYYEQLRRVLELYPREQVLVLQYERCAAEPIAEMERTCRFLGLRSRRRPSERLLSREGPAKQGGRPLEEATRCELTALYREEVRRLVELVPEIDLTLWPNFRELAADSSA
jgi:Sulfotransferase family